jgi:hypothetical protein
MDGFIPIQFPFVQSIILVVSNTYPPLYLVIQNSLSNTVLLSSLRIFSPLFQYSEILPVVHISCNSRCLHKICHAEES